MSQRQPNVIVFFTDQQRHDTTGVHGCPLNLTPNFDRMAAEGTHVYHSFTCQPVCGPARSCLQTGMYATQTGCYTNGIALPPNLRTLAHCFGDAGYATGYIGKWHLGSPERIGAVPTEERGGYDYWLASNMLEYTSDAYHCVMYDNDGNEVKLPGYRVDALTDAAIRFINTRQDVPFYLFISYIEPHHQNHRDDYPAPEGYAEQYAGRWMPPDLQALQGSAPQHLPGYFGMIRRLDEALGRIRDALKSLNLSEDTILLYTADHGNHFKTRNSEYKRSCHDASLRVPTALYGAGFTGGGRVQELVSLVDLPPTLLDAANIHIPDSMQGHSLLPLVRGNHSDWQQEVFAQISESQVARCIRTKRWKYTVTALDKDAWRDSGSDRYTETHLYDLLADPYELCNLVGSAAHQEVRDALRARLVGRMQAAREVPPVIIPFVPTTPPGQRRVLPNEV